MELEKRIKLIKQNQNIEKPKDSTPSQQNLNKKKQTINENSPIIQRLREDEERAKLKSLSDDELIERNFKEEADALRANLANNLESIQDYIRQNRTPESRNALQSNANAKSHHNVEMPQHTSETLRRTPLPKHHFADSPHDTENSAESHPQNHATQDTSMQDDFTEKVDLSDIMIKPQDFSPDSPQQQNLSQNSNIPQDFTQNLSPNSTAPNTTPNIISNLAQQKNSDEFVGIYNPPNFEDGRVHSIEIIDKIDNYDIEFPKIKALYDDILGSNNIIDSTDDIDTLNEINNSLVLAQKKLEERLKVAKIKQKLGDIKSITPIDSTPANISQRDSMDFQQADIMQRDFPQSDFPQPLPPQNLPQQNFSQGDFSPDSPQMDFMRIHSPIYPQQEADSAPIFSQDSSFSHDFSQMPKLSQSGEIPSIEIVRDSNISLKDSAKNFDETSTAESSKIEVINMDFASGDSAKADLIEIDSSDSASFSNATANEIDAMHEIDSVYEADLSPQENSQDFTQDATTARLDEIQPLQSIQNAESQGDSTPSATKEEFGEDFFDIKPQFTHDSTQMQDSAMQNLPSQNGDSSEFQLPPLDLLNTPLTQKVDIDDSEIDIKVQNLFTKLRMFKIEGDIVRTYSGPVVTTFEFRPAANVKVSRIQNMEGDLAMTLKATSIRIQAPIPGKDVVGIEIPNNHVQTIYLREVFESDEFRNSPAHLAIALGKDVIGNPVIEDLATLPHLLIAGTTGSGKSVGINAMILSLIYKNTPKDLRFIMIDPKFLEFGLYKDIPHLLTPIITDPKKAIVALSKAVDEMNRRYELMDKAKVRTIVGYNELAQQNNEEKLPYIVIIIDEFADLMLMGGREAEQFLISLAGKARASGIHLIIATQRPTVNVVTGLIKGNLPSKISYRVGSKIDSKVILDETGAEALLGRGDLLFSKTSNIVRLHAPYNDEREIERVVSFLKSQQKVEYDESFLLEQKEAPSPQSTQTSGENYYIEKAKEIILQSNKTSISYLQRSLNVGFNKAATIIEALEKEGFLSPPNHKGTREILG